MSSRSMVFALVGCGGGSSDSQTAKIRYSQESSMGSGFTEITGIRGVNKSPDVYLTWSNEDKGTNYALLYQGAIQMTRESQWNRIGPTGKCIVTISNPCEVPSGLNFYGPNNGLNPGNVVVVGNYKKTDAVGHAFIMSMGNTPDDLATYT